jgi:hypothetical protein
MIESLPDTTLFNETDTGEIVVTGTKVTFDQVAEAYARSNSRVIRHLNAKAFAFDNGLSVGHVVTLFRFIGELRGDEFICTSDSMAGDYRHEQCDTTPTIDDDYDHRPSYLEGFESDPDDAS